MVIPAGQVKLTRTLQQWWQQNATQHGPLKALRAFCSELWGFIRESTPEQRRRRYGDVEFDWDYRVDTTSATVGWRERLLGVFHSPYQPTEPALFREMIRTLAIDFANFTFIDLGSGKGRTLLMASDYPFRRIVGVELLTELHRVAEKNLLQYKSERQKCFRLEAFADDARRFVFPQEPTVLYLFNPLPVEGLAQVIANLELSLHMNPRKIFVLYHNPLHEELLARCRCLKKVGGTHQFVIYAS